MRSRSATGVRRKLLIGAGMGSVAVAAGFAVWSYVANGGPTAPAAATMGAASATAEASDAPAAIPGGWAAAEWAVVPNPNPFGPPAPRGSAPLRVDGVVDTGELFIAWGRIPTPGRNQFDDFGGVFVSRDGASWKPVVVDHGVNAPSTSSIYGVAAGPGGFLAYGDVCCDPEGRALWHSPDAEVWTRIEIEGNRSPAGAYVTAMVSAGNAWVASGTAPDGTGFIWASEDGITWEVVLEAGADGPGGRGIADIAAKGDGFVAVGTVTGPDGTYDAAVWESDDGRAWQRVGEQDPALVGLDELMPNSVTAFGERVLVYASFGATEDRARCERLGRDAECHWVLGERLLVADADRSWASVDPRALPQMAGGEQPIEFRLVAAGGPGVVLLGESSGPDSPDTNLFTSPDGIEWTMVPPLEPLGDAVATAFAVRGERALAITELFDGQRSTWRVWLARLR